MGERSHVKLSFVQYNWILLIINVHWLGYWLGVIKQQAIAWANVDPIISHPMESLGHNEVMHKMASVIFWKLLSSGKILFTHNQYHSDTIDI